MHKELHNAAVKAINTIFSDTSVPHSTTRERLEAIRDEIDSLLEALET